MNGCSPKIIVNYLPQFHTIPENDAWWGKGFTDWEAVKKARPLFSGHKQPRVPAEKNYYSLDNYDSLKWQAAIARQYGVYGFGIYHYWFSSTQNLLTAPSEILLENKDIDINFMFIWDNSSWKRSWSAVKDGNDWAPKFDTNDENSRGGNGLLAELIYGDEADWKQHFEYLLPFFKDHRYIKVGNRPLFGFMRPTNDFEVISKMVKYWDTLAQAHGFDGVRCISNATIASRVTGKSLDYQFSYAPLQCKDAIAFFSDRIRNRFHKKGFLRIYDYDSYWKRLLRYSKHANTGRNARTE